MNDASHPGHGRRRPHRLRALLLATLALALAALGGGCDEDGTAGPAPETLVLDVRVHLLQSSASESLTTTLSEDEIRRLFDRVDAVWDQAGIQWRIESFILEPAPNGAEFEAFLRGEAPAGFDLASVIPRQNLTEGRWDVFFIRVLGAGSGGIYFPGIPAVLQPEVDPFGVRGLEGALTRILAHELGHSLGLGHVPCPPEGNLMAPNCPAPDRTRLRQDQITAARAQARSGPFREGDPIGAR